MTDQPNPTRTPQPGGWHAAFRLNLEQQRNRARDLQRAVRAGDPAAVQRVRVRHPKGAHADTTPDFRLADAQLVIAREAGAPSWPKLKAHIEAMQHAHIGMTRPGPALDADIPTLHIRCGSDVKSTLAEGGFAGDFLEYSDPLCQGPVVDAADWVDRRAAFLGRTYGDWLSLQTQAIRAGRARTEADLLAAAERYERVVMWFEHDSYDQLVLARCLAVFAERPARRLELISIDHFPGGMRFIGLGQLPPEALRLVWETRQPVSAPQLSVGRAVWDALRAPDPSALAAIARDKSPALPHLAGAVHRHCQELPGIRDGLSLTQRILLQMLAEAPHRIGRLFHELMTEREPLPFQSDLMVRDILQEMTEVSEPVFTGVIDEPESPWWRELLTITPLGRAVLAGDVDWLSLRPPERWLGGVAIRPGQSNWRWQAERDRAVLVSA